MTDPVEAARERLLDVVILPADTLAAAMDAFEAAIRADVVPTGDAGLDVERLGRAIVEHRTKFWASEPCVANCSKDIAAEYARLSSSDTGGRG